jgi:DNA-binding NarL/FixJ family response regulator
LNLHCSLAWGESNLIQLLLADSHQLLHAGIQSILAPTSEITLIGTATNDIQLRQRCNQRQPDVLLLALNITEPPWTDLLKYLQKNIPKQKP